MRHIRARRRFKLILTVLLTLTSIFFFETKVESFAPQLKIFAESRIEDILDKRVRFSIGRLEGGIFNPLTVNDCKITNDAGNLIFPDLEIASIRSNYRLWDVVFNKKSPISVLRPSSNEPCIDVKFARNYNEIDGFLRIKGALAAAKIKGYVNLSGKERIDFTAVVKERSFEGEIKSSLGLLKVKGSLSDENELTADININHLRLNGFDIVCDVILKNKITREASGPDSPSLEGEFATRNLILNYRPFLDLKASYKIRDGVLYISNMEAGSDFKLYGKIDLKDDRNLDIVIVADNANVNQALSIMNVKDGVLMGGMMNGKFEFKGPMENPKLDAKIDIKHGEIAGVDFDLLSARLKGEGPIVRIEESRITRPSGYLTLAGEMDFSKGRHGKGNIFENVNMTSDDMAVIWDGWNAKDMHDFREIRMEKKMSDEVRLGFKRFIADKKVDESLRERDEFELEYKPHPHDSLKMKFGQDRNYFGLEYDDTF